MCIYVYIYIYIYIFFYLVRHGNHQDVCLWFPPSTSSNVLFYGFPSLFFCMVSVVAANVLFMVSVVGCFMVSVAAGKRGFMASVAGCSMDSAVAGGVSFVKAYRVIPRFGGF